MVRVLFYASILALVISAAFLFLPLYGSVIIAALLLIAFVLVLIFKHKNKFNSAFMLFICLAFSIYGIFSLLWVDKIEGLDERVAVIEGYITEDPDNYDTYSSYILNTTRVEIKGRTENIPQHFKLRFTESSDYAFSSFVNVKATIKLSRLDGDYKNLNFANKVYLNGQLLDVMTIEEMEHKPLKYYPYLISKGINKLLYNNLGYEEAALSSAILIGDATGLTDEFYGNSKVTGVTHMLVVSGTHLSIITMGLIEFLKRTKMPYKLRNLLMFIVIYLIMSVCGFSASVVRAGLTYVIYFIGNLLFKKSDGLNALGAASILFLFDSPFLFYNIGYLLSYMATFAVIFLTGKVYGILTKLYIKGVIGKAYNAIAFILAQTLSASFMTLPISMIAFGYFSAISPIANILLTHAVNGILIISIFSVLLAAVPILNIFSFGFFFAINYLCKFTYFVVNTLAKLDFALVSVEPIHYIAWALIFIALFGYIFAQKIREYMHVYKITALSLIAVFMSAIVIFTYTHFKPQNYTKLSLVDVGNGICAIIKYKNDSLLVGLGDSEYDYKRITQRAFKLGIRRIDTILIPTLSKDYAGGASNSLENIEYGRLVSRENGTYSKAVKDAENTTFFNDNISSSVGEIDFTVRGFSAIVTTPDISIEINNSQMNVMTECDILVSLNYVPIDNNKTVFICGNQIDRYYNKDNFYYINKDTTMEIGENNG